MNILHTDTHWNNIVFAGADQLPSGNPRQPAVAPLLLLLFDLHGQLIGAVVQRQPHAVAVALLFEHVLGDFF